MEEFRSQTRENLMRNILRLYRETFLKHDEIQCQVIAADADASPGADLCATLNDLNLNLNPKVAHDFDQKFNEVLTASYYKQLECIPALLDFCYMFAVKVLSQNKAPFIKLPHGEAKLRLVFSTLAADAQSNTQINTQSNTQINTPADPQSNVQINTRLIEDVRDAFACVIKNKTIIILRKESPPFHMQYNLALNEFHADVSREVIPVIKNLINLLLKIPRAE